MAGLKDAIEEFWKKRLDVYRADSTEIVRNARAAKRAAKDHVGRWLWELLQNSDDAEAKVVRIRQGKGAIYVADDGKGLKPSAVEAISGTDFSDKSTAAIGRKGIGFKAVYTVSHNPQVFSLNSEGLEFSRAKAEQWLRANGFSSDQGTPYQWLPFFLPRDEVEREDGILRELHNFSTVVKLPSSRTSVTLNVLEHFPAYGLLPFRHVRKLHIQCEHGESSSIEISDSGEGAVRVSDNRTKGEPVTWRVQKKIKHPPATVLGTLDQEDHRWVEKEGVSFLVAAPLSDEGIVRPLEKYPPIHVFYPAEKDLSPVRVLLHAEFLIKSDRSALTPIEGGNFNGWVADKLADLFIEFVRNQYNPTAPAAYLRLLVPLSERENHPVAQTLWERIAKRAKKHLRLPNASAALKLCCSSARFLRVSVEVAKARKLVEATGGRSALLHAALDHDDEARKALKELECQCITDNDLLELLKQTAPQKAKEHNWIWTCWEWVAAWVAQKPYGDEHKERVAQVKDLRLIPADGAVHSMNSLASEIVTWRTPEVSDNTPAWLPIRFLDDWFRDRLMRCAKKDNDSIRKLSDDLGIKEPTNDVVLKALSKAIEQYWRNPDYNPGRFIESLLANDWHETLSPPKGLERCPIRADIVGRRTDEWVEAGQAYFGNEWDEPELAELFRGVQGVAWAQKPEHDPDKYRTILEWLGVMKCPRIRPDAKPDPDEGRRIKAHLPPDSWPSSPPPKPLLLDKLDIRTLRPDHAACLLVILATNWSDYYHSESEMPVKCAGPRGGWRPQQRVPALWWEQVTCRLKPPLTRNQAEPASLKESWLPDKRTRNAVGDLLPIIDIDSFGKQKSQVATWLREVVRVRTSLEQIKPDEWRTILSKTIPSRVSEEKANSDEKRRDRVKKWYIACLESLDEQEESFEGTLGKVPLLCHKGNSWKYITDETRWLADDNDAAEAFESEIWQISFPERYRKAAQKYFALKSLSQSVKIELLPGSPGGGTDELQSILHRALPYVFVRRSFKTEHDPGELRNKLKKLQVCIVNDLKAKLTIDGVGRKVVKKDWGVDKYELLIAAEEGSKESFLARALADFLHARSDAEFYENLLRCGSDEDRRKKLLADNIPRDEIDRLLREFQQEPPEPPIERMAPNHPHRLRGPDHTAGPLALQPHHYT